ncbi:MAG TPA: hypothetical protein VGP72_14630 [Planctomycetota bacterium]|jgi:hypothetical protein
MPTTLDEALLRLRTVETERDALREQLRVALLALRAIHEAQRCTAALIETRPK